jgi:hypothetical protein
MSKKSKLDQYYTKPEVANSCLDILLNYLGDKDSYSFVEPSAGTGSFLKEGLKWEAYDLEPKHPLVTKSDFFNVTGLKDKVVVGNPPFGFASSLALKFINHAEKCGASIVAFILPKTFKKKLFQEKVSHELILDLEFDLPEDSFTLEGESYNVPCVFQVWVRGKREPLIFEKYFVKGSSEDCDFMLRRVGGRSGRLINKEDFTPSSSLYVKGDKTLIHKYQEDICKEASYTVGVRSITLDEINYIITQKES